MSGTKRVHASGYTRWGRRHGRAQQPLLLALALQHCLCAKHMAGRAHCWHVKCTCPFRAAAPPSSLSPSKFPVKSQVPPLAPYAPFFGEPMHVCVLANSAPAGPPSVNFCLGVCGVLKKLH